MRKRFDLGVLAENGLRRGFTTGSAAAAGALAAVLRLVRGEAVGVVDVPLPDGEHFLRIAIRGTGELEEGGVWAEVEKDGGDDPDQTHRAVIRVVVRRNEGLGIRYLRGEGVGVVTRPGLRVAVGEPAINPVPRGMIAAAVETVDAGLDFDVEVGCLGGEEIARRTFNPRLGIKGGISILGTTGVVEPKSMLSFRASIEVYVRVAMGEMAPEIVLTPGNLGQRFARSELDLPTHRVVQMSNFVGFALGCVSECVRERGERLRRLWVVGHPGKLCKVLGDVWDTHSSGGLSAVDALRGGCFRLFENGAFGAVASVEELIVAMAGIESEVRDAFWCSVCDRIAGRVGGRTEGVGVVRVVLFGLDGSRLGEGGWGAD